MTTRVFLSLFTLLAALLPACGSADNDSGTTSGAAGASAIRGSSAGSNNAPVSRGGGAPLPDVGAGGFGAPGGAAAGSNVLGTAPPGTWNGARSTRVDEARLQAEYTAWKTAHVEACANGSWVV